MWYDRQGRECFLEILALTYAPGWSMFDTYILLEQYAFQIIGRICKN